MIPITLALAALIAIAVFARQFTWRVKAAMLAVLVAMIISLMR
jgi:hypothetical protein